MDKEYALSIFKNKQIPNDINLYDFKLIVIQEITGHDRNDPNGILLINKILNNFEFDITKTHEILKNLSYYDIYSLICLSKNEIIKQTLILYRTAFYLADIDT